MVAIDGTRATIDFELSDGSTWSVPTVRSLGVREAREITRKLRASAEAGGDGTDEFVDFLDEHAPGLVDRLVISELQQIAQLWIDAGGGLGK